MHDDSVPQCAKADLSSYEIKELRDRLQGFIDILRRKQGSCELSLVVTKLQEAKMWAGMQLANIPNNVDLNKERDEKELSACETTTLWE